MFGGLKSVSGNGAGGVFGVKKFLPFIARNLSVSLFAKAPNVISLHRDRRFASHEHKNVWPYALDLKPVIRIAREFGVTRRCPPHYHSILASMALRI
jgi:hypothetical protein